MIKGVIIAALLLSGPALIPGACRAAQVKDKFTSVDYKGIAMGGWIERQIRDDASNGWVFQRNKLSLEGFYVWFPSSGFIRPWYPVPKPGESIDPGVISTRQDGWTPFVPYYNTFVEKVGSYGEGDFEGHWMDMLFRQVWIGGYTQNEGLARKCVADILASTDSTGYLGPNPAQGRYKSTTLTPWGQNTGINESDGIGCLYDALFTYYRFTGDKKVVDAIKKAADALIEATGKDSKTGVWAGGLLTIPLARLYVMTGDQKYMDKAVQVWKGDADHLRTPNQPGDFRYYKHHGATAGIVVLSTIELYRATGEKQYLDLARDMSDQIVQYALQSHGAPTGHLETLVPPGPRENTEGCETAWWAMDWMEMLAVTGEAKYADLAEKCILNALPGGSGKDSVTAAYFSRPNQLFAAKGKNCGTVYGVTQGCDCCLGNLGRVMPIMAEHMVMSDGKDGLVVPFYGPCSVETEISGRKLRITEKTEYPFSENVKIMVGLDGQPTSFPIRLRNPGWCSNPALRVNGAAVDAKPRDGWIVLDRRWKSGDTIGLSLPMRVRVDRDKEGLAIVERGPLLYTLPIKGRRIPLDKWGSFEQVVTPDDNWNYALMLDETDPAASFRLKNLRVPKGSHVWEYPPVALDVDACRLADWKFSKPIEELMPVESTDAPEPALPNKPYRALGNREKITLVPYGFTILRMTHMPVMSDEQ